ncbi:protein-glutamate methylesterase/protein-glutamine glutaminase [Planctomycetaceae bacterium SH139]
MTTLKCIVVDDSLIFRKVVRDCLGKLPQVDVIDVASDGTRAVEKIAQHRPDLVTLDVEMPGLNGLEVLRAIREQKIDTDVIMVSSQTDRAASVTTQALSLGAFDYILKPNCSSPEANFAELFAELQPRVELIRKHRQRRQQRVELAATTTFRSMERQTSAPTNRGERATFGKTTPSVGVRSMGRTGVNNPPPRSGINPTFTATQPRDQTRPRRATAMIPPEVIVIGVSTGGPAALREVLPKLAGNFPIPILIVQHMPPLFTASLARDLNSCCKLTVCEAVHGQILSGGNVYIAPGGAHMRIGGLGSQRHVEITDDPPVRACRPSVDYLFESAARTYGAATLAVVLTGMGNDGTAGSRAIGALGGRTIVQDEASCTVFGMPRQVIEAGQADRIEPLSSIPALLSRAVISGAIACL